MNAVFDQVKSAATAQTVPDDDFDWHGDCVILNKRPPVAVCFTPAGDMIIRQKHDDGPHGVWYGDPYVLIGAEQINEFLDKLTDACGIPSVGKP